MIVDRLSRTGPVPDARIVHLGVGAFHRAHQAAYTADVDDEHHWGISGFTGRRPDMATVLAGQDGVYSLIIRAAGRDSVRVIESIAEVHDGARLDVFAERCAAPHTALITLTVSEAGYYLRTDGTLDVGASVIRSDMDVLARVIPLDDHRFFAELASSRIASAPARLLLGLEARRRRDTGPVSVVPCDNLSANGERLRALLLEIARPFRSLVDWLVDSVEFVSTVVDRITPATVAADLATARHALGRIDRAPVVTEPFSDWVLAGRFPAGRPAWERASARFVSTVEPYEQRKLWLLNGAHTMLATAGLIRGHQTVAEAIHDDVIRGRVFDLWDDASRLLNSEELDLPSYRLRLLDRFANERIEHRLSQISQDSGAKIAVRIAPVALAERRLGRPARSAAFAFAAWITAVRRSLVEPDGSAVTQALEGPESTRGLVRLVSAELAEDSAFLGEVQLAMSDLEDSLAPLTRGRRGEP